MDAIRSTLLFAKGVLLVEGDAEQVMIPAMLKSVYGVSPDELGFSVISMSSAFFEHVAVVFAEERIQRRCAIVTDLDQAILPLSGNPDDDDREETAARASQEAGQIRRQKLVEFTNGNEWVQPFFAPHTFEVDFVAAHNAREVVRTLDSIYTDHNAKAKAKERLESIDSTSYGPEIIRLANKIGKGWFALLLSEHLDSWTYFPEYILRAIAFACAQSITPAALKTMGQYRLAKHNSEELKAVSASGDIQTLAPKEFLKAFRKADPSDSLSRFCQYVAEYHNR
jgi:putative ATP-dependent endonuclease of the OLD family